MWWAAAGALARRARAQLGNERLERYPAIFLQFRIMIAVHHGQGIDAALDRGVSRGDVLRFRSTRMQVEQ
jgi:hypothetical protein